LIFCDGFSTTEEVAMEKKLNLPRIIASVLILALCVIALPVRVAQAADFYVNPGDSIQMAINGASAGDTVHVAAGTYTGLISLKDGVRVQGAGAAVTTIDGNYNGTVVSVAQNASTNTVLDGFTIIHGNAGSGGGANIYQASPTISNCIFSHNWANWGGGMIVQVNSSPVITNCIFYGNSSRSGGAIDVENHCAPQVINCTSWGNTAIDGFGGGMLIDYQSSPIVANCIFWGDLYSTEIFNVNSTPAFSFCDIQGGYPGGTNIVDFDPFFVDAAGGDFHLQPTSLCINSGNNTAPSLPATDFEGDPRILLGTVDLGADEFYAPAVINEFVINLTGTDTYEYVEIYGQPSLDCSYFTLLDIEGDAGANPGNIDRAYPVGSTDAAGFWWTGFLNNELENGTSSLLLVLSFNGTAGADVDSDNDGVIDNQLWNKVVDSLAVTDGDAGDRVYSPLILPAPLSNGASRYPDDSANWYRNDFAGAGLPGFPATPTDGQAYNTPGEPNELFGADLAVVKTVSPDPVIAGTDLTYTLTVTNHGPETAAVTCNDTLPAGLIFQSADVSPSMTNIVAYSSTGFCTWFNFSLAASQNATLTLVVTVPSSTPHGTVLSNTAVVSGNVTDLDTANNSFTANTTVDTLADLSLSKTDSPDPDSNGGQLTYTLIVANAGPSDAQGVTLTDAIPSGLQSVQFSTDDGVSWSPWTGSLDLGTMAAGSSRTVLIKGTVVPVLAREFHISNTATVSSVTADPAGANNSASADTLINPLSVGGEVQEVSKTGLLLPWLVLALVVVAGVALFAFRRKPANR
jgi:uncharacterized repeat protein (TIGR01451 family)